MQQRFSFCDVLKSFVSVCLQLSKIYIQELGREIIVIIEKIKEYPPSERLSDWFKRKAKELEAWKAERDDNNEI